MPVDEVTATTIVARYFLPPDDRIVAVDRHNDGVVVTTELDDWFIAPRHLPDFDEVQDGDRLFEVRLFVAADPPPAAHGVIVSREGHLFLLDDLDEFRAYWQLARGHLSPLILATLVARYQGRPAATLIRQFAEVQPLLTARQQTALEGVVPPRLVENAGGFVVEFGTIELAGPGLGTVVLRHWRVECDEHGRLVWSILPIDDSRPTYSARRANRDDER